MEIISNTQVNKLIMKPVLSVIIPVYNNGYSLRTEAFPSLLANSIFRKMEIILIDDGSVDDSTLSTCANLSRRFPNVVFYPLDGPASGSASRPRNFGLQLATSKYVSFLDPDNRISKHGYDKLYGLITIARAFCPQIDFVTGFQVKQLFGDESITARNCSRFPLRIINSTRKYIVDRNFPTISSQAAIFRRSFLTSSNLQFVNNAIGQDTLFGWQALLSARLVLATDTAHVLYLADRSGSVTNLQNIDWFKKSYIREEAQVRWLKETKLLNHYLQSNRNKMRWSLYKKRLACLPGEEVVQAKEILVQIQRLFDR